MMPMLATNLDAGRVTADLFGDDRIWQVKVDGDRLLTVSDGNGQVAGFNRNGDPTTVPEPARTALAHFAMPLVLDGELLNGIFVVFDLVAAQGKFGLPLEHRLTMLESLLGAWEPAGMVLCPTARTLAEKEHMFRQVTDRDGEGWIVKRSDSEWEPQAKPGERAKTWLKLKRLHDVDCIVAWLGTPDTNGKLNMGLDMLDDEGQRVNVGECTRLAGDGNRVQPGDVVAVQILYATDGNRLYQPTRPRLRGDKPADQCTIDQLDAVRTFKELPLTWEPLMASAR